MALALCLYRTDSVEGRYTVVQYNKILQTFQELRKNIQQRLKQYKTPHSSPVFSEYFWEYWPRYITAPHLYLVPQQGKG